MTFLSHNGLRRTAAARWRGFTLVELLIVLTVILIIAAIAIPKLLTVKQHANATAAVGNLHALFNAITMYESSYATIGCPANLAALGPPAAGSGPSSSAADLMDESMAAAGTTPKQGYIFTYAPVAGTPCGLFSINANPVSGQGTRFYYMDQSGMIRYNDNTAATATSALIG